MGLFFGQSAHLDVDLGLEMKERRLRESKIRVEIPFFTGLFRAKLAIGLTI
jgi:hypothetical protein